MSLIGRKDGKLMVEKLSKPMQKAWLLSDADKKPLNTKASGTSMLINVPADAPDKIDTVIVLE